MTDRPTAIRYRTLAWLTVAAALAYLCRNAVGVTESTIRTELGLTHEQSGWFMGAFFWTYALFQVPTGWFSERVGTRLALSIFALCWSFATFGVGIASGFWLLIVAQLLMGIAQAGIFPASCNSVGYWMPLSERSLACGVLAAGMQVGAIAASGFAGELTEGSGWRWVFVGFAFPGILWTLGFYWWFRDRPSQLSTVNASELALIQAGRVEQVSNEEQSTSELTELYNIAANPVLWLLCGQQICRASGYMFFASWFPTFLQETRGVSVSESGYLQGLVLAGTLVGSIFGGMVTDWIWKRTGSLRLSRSGVGAVALGSCSLLILAAWFVQSVSLAVILLALGSLSAAIAGPCALAATIDIGGPRVPQVFGMMNMTGNLAAAACPVLVGILFQRTENWNLILLLFAAIYFIGAIFWVLTNTENRISTEPDDS